VIAKYRLEYQAPFMRVKITEKSPCNNTTSTITFLALTQARGIKRYYSDLNFIGKHFLIASETNLNMKRHYTICNCMKKEHYNEYLRLMKAAM
jgi:hypothetical protein